MDSLKRFFLPKKILKFKKGWEKVGLWIPLFDFFSNKNNLKIKKRLGEDKVGLCFLKRFFFQIRKFKNSKKAGRRLPYFFYQTHIKSK